MKAFTAFSSGEKDFHSSDSMGRNEFVQVFVQRAFTNVKADMNEQRNLRQYVKHR